MVKRTKPIQSKKPPEPKLAAKLDIDIRIRFGRNATGIAVTTTDLEGRKETSAEIVPRLPKSKEPD